MRHIPNDGQAARAEDWQISARLLHDLKDYVDTQGNDADAEFGLTLARGLTYPTDDAGWIDWDRYPPDGHGFPEVR